MMRSFGSDANIARNCPMGMLRNPGMGFRYR